jgi:hypothetical protein
VDVMGAAETARIVSRGAAFLRYHSYSYQFAGWESILFWGSFLQDNYSGRVFKLIAFAIYLVGRHHLVL